MAQAREDAGAMGGEQAAEDEVDGTGGVGIDETRAVYF
jgi:hypothetical protein